MTVLLGVILALAVAAIVGWPLVRKESDGEEMEPTIDTELTDLLLQREAAFSAINELDSDHAMGNLSLRDYGELREKYEQKAVSVIRDIGELQKAQDDEIELKVLNLRRGNEFDTSGKVMVCANCDAELDAEDNFCSGCGTVRSLVCPDCGNVSETGDQFCAHCGTRLGGKGDV